jgi:hypothetical protein
MVETSAIIIVETEPKPRTPATTSFWLHRC